MQKLAISKELINNNRILISIIYRIQISVINADGVKIEEPIVLETKWDYKRTVERANEKDYIF